MKKINWHNIRVLLMLGVVVFLYSFTSKRNESRRLKDIHIEFSDSDKNFLTYDMVNKLLIQNFDTVTSIRKDKLDLNKLEKRLNKHPMIENAEVFSTIDGRLKTVVTQKTPIGRVYQGSDSYYIDYKGNKMPLSENFTSRVPLVTGEVDKADPEKLNDLLRYIHDDDFLVKNIIGIEIKPSGTLRMLNRNYNYEIDFGELINVERKFNNYKAFFQNGVKDTLIEKYKTINLKFTQQVVCTKN